MPNDHKIDISRLEERVTSISDALAKHMSADAFRELIRYWRQPGWTTPAEFILVSAIVDSMHAQVAALTKLKSDLIKGSEAVSVRTTGKA